MTRHWKVVWCYRSLTTDEWKNYDSTTPNLTSPDYNGYEQHKELISKAFIHSLTKLPAIYLKGL